MAHLIEIARSAKHRRASASCGRHLLAGMGHFGMGPSRPMSKLAAKSDSRSRLDGAARIAVVSRTSLRRAQQGGSHAQERREGRKYRKGDLPKNSPPIVSLQQWEAARQQLLVKEKALTRARDALVAERRRMPWLAVEKRTSSTA